MSLLQWETYIPADKLLLEGMRGLKLKHLREAGECSVVQCLNIEGMVWHHLWETCLHRPVRDKYKSRIYKPISRLPPDTFNTAVRNLEERLQSVYLCNKCHRQVHKLYHIRRQELRTHNINSTAYMHLFGKLEVDESVLSVGEKQRLACVKRELKRVKF
eukprot:GDKI01046651.1.p1 GENE.GDKI01046651.1~~GDKI01046651.1.p1  ORF type:complete len:159 (-),score=7.25 GDKI01046651.1:25-501(-)